ncbi:MAG: hypothetical protein Faunusvirus8_8 [Faunusvirus sp.]|jgi:hypothetical protein|uniref:Uncharacterized protein n=1 Tax=Faunusvirus sp. TaxID=2487766 RepID=A0A3G4ZZ55_9VIRU|nr:MAG: hypothetical protein Faunusvirus8_8 [Faunusvirus sp.]
MSFLVDTKNEYTILLTNILGPLLYKGIKSIYTGIMECKDISVQKLKSFQLALKDIHQWKKETIEKETNGIIGESGYGVCFEQLVRAVFKANIIILSSDPFSTTHAAPPHININCSEFIHKCYIECAKIFMKNPFLMKDELTVDVRERILLREESIKLIKDAIKDSIRRMLPLDMILRDFLGTELNPAINEGVIGDSKQPDKPLVPLTLNGGNTAESNNEVKKSDTTDSHTRIKSSERPDKRDSKDGKDSKSDKPEEVADFDKRPIDRLKAPDDKKHEPVIGKTAHISELDSDDNAESYKVGGEMKGDYIYKYSNKKA